MRRPLTAERAAGKPLLTVTDPVEKVLCHPLNLDQRSLVELFGPYMHLAPPEGVKPLVGY